MEAGGRAEAAEEGGGATLGPFVKQSKMVSRDRPEVEPSGDAPCPQGFWERLVQQPSYHWVEEYHEAPSLLELCRKKRKGPKQKGLGHLRGFSVLYHLEEVKRRQSNIDKQKAAQQRGALPQLSPQGNGMAGDLPAHLLSPARTPEPYARPFLGRGTGAQLLLHPQWNPNLREPLRVPGERPLAFYAVAAHHRSPCGGRAELHPEE